MLWVLLFGVIATWLVVGLIDERLDEHDDEDEKED